MRYSTQLIIMHTSRTYRQGDVLLQEVSIEVSSLSPRSTGPLVVLAIGEATGHHHSILRQDADDYTTDSGETIVSVKDGAVFAHQEHTAIPLPIGTYKSIRQREYSPAAIRNVAD
jgi:hypothetical protein